VHRPDDDRRSDNDAPAPGKVDPATPAPDADATATWGGEGGAGDYRGGPVTSDGTDRKKVKKEIKM